MDPSKPGFSISLIRRPINRPGYAVVDLGTLGEYSEAQAINNNGQIVGVSRVVRPSAADFVKGFIYERGKMRELPSLAEAGSTIAYDINDQGDIAASSLIAEEGFWRPVRIHESALTDLSGNTHGGEGYGINEAGEVVGGANFPSENGGFNFRAYRYGAQMIDLGTFYESSMALGVNGQWVVGQCDNRFFNAPRAFVYTPSGGMVDLNPHLGTDCLRSYASAVNSSGHIAGSFTPAPGGPYRAFLYVEETFTDLGNLNVNNSGGYTYVKAINNKGVIVGWSSMTEPYESNHAFIYDGGPLKDLNSMIPSDSGWELIGANDINDRGQIVGIAHRQGEQWSHAVLLEPTRGF